MDPRPVTGRAARISRRARTRAGRPGTRADAGPDALAGPARRPDSGGTARGDHRGSDARGASRSHPDGRGGPDSRRDAHAGSDPRSRRRSDSDASAHADSTSRPRRLRRPSSPAPPPAEGQAAAALEPVVLTALSPLAIRRPGRALLDLRGTGLRSDLRARVLPLRDAPRGITVARQKWVSASLVTVLLELDAGRHAGGLRHRPRRPGRRPDEAAAVHRHEVGSAPVHVWLRPEVALLAGPGDPQAPHRGCTTIPRAGAQRVHRISTDRGGKVDTAPA